MTRRIYRYDTETAVCDNCGRTFKTRALVPKCSKCNGVARFADYLKPAARGAKERGGIRA